MVKYKNMIMSAVLSSIILIQSIIFGVIWYLFYKYNIIDPFYEKGTLLLMLVYILLIFFFTNIYGGYKVGVYRITDIVYSQLISLLLTNTITYFQLSLIAREMLNLIGIIVMTSLQTLCIVLWSYIANRIYIKLNPVMKVVVIFGNSDVSRFIEKLKLRSDKYDIVDIFEISKECEDRINNVDYSKYDAIMLYDIDSIYRNKILKYSYSKSIPTYVTPKISDIIMGSSDKFHLFDTPLLISKNRGLSYEQRLLKRMIDIIGASLLIVVSLPLMAIVAILIKISDGGPVIFKQERLTLNNESFDIYKFRSMIVNAEEDGMARLATKNDGRITSIGKVIRAVRFDELPQLFNVLKGDMSLVGPRPERPELVDQYIERMPEFDFRTKVKAGITGYAQVMGRYNTTAYDKLKLDLLYIENFSFIMDFKLILMTIKIIFMPEKAEGVIDDETPFMNEKDNPIC